MGLSFENPAGFFALLGIPAVLVFHYWQRRPRQVTVSTLFLLQQLHRESAGGNRFGRLRSSSALWLQLLAVLILTWLMCGPRWMERSSVQQVVLVLDGSASMSVCRTRIEAQLPPAMANLATAAARTEWYLLDSRRDAGHLYHGDSMAGLMNALEDWKPSGGTHDPGPALHLGRNLAGSEGTLIYVTDHDQQDLPQGARLFAAGLADDNAGIAGVTVAEEEGRTVWRAILRNYSNRPLSREWWIESGGVPGRRQPVTLAPRGTQQIQAAFGEGQNEVELRISTDNFPADDAAVAVRPLPRRLTVVLPQDELSLPQDQQHFTALFSSLPGITVTADRAGADVLVTHFNPMDPVIADRAACVFVRDSLPDAPASVGMLLVEPHPLTDHLNWHGLVAQQGDTIPAQPGDKVLVWKGDRPMLFLRGPAERPMLCFNFDFRKSNARRLPAFVIGIHRFLEDIRSRTVREEWRNVACGQKLRCPVDLSRDAPAVTLTWKAAGEGKDGSLSVPAAQASVLTAPEVPALLELKQGERLLLKAGACFADVRESDLSAAASRQDLEGAEAKLVERRSHEDSAWRFWLVLLLGVMAASWWFPAEPGRRRPAMV